MFAAVVALVALAALQLPAARAVGTDIREDPDRTVDTIRQVGELRSRLMMENEDYEDIYPRHGQGPQTSSQPDRFAVVRNADDSRCPEQDVSYNFTGHSNKNISRQDFGHREARRIMQDLRFVVGMEEKKEQNSADSKKNSTEGNATLYPKLGKEITEEKRLVERQIEGNLEHQNETHNSANKGKYVKKEISQYSRSGKQITEEKKLVQQKMELNIEHQNKTHNDTKAMENMQKENASQYLEVRKHIIKDQTPVQGKVEGKRDLHNKTSKENETNMGNEKNFTKGNTAQSPEVIKHNKSEEKVSAQRKIGAKTEVQNKTNAENGEYFKKDNVTQHPEVKTPKTEEKIPVQRKGKGETKLQKTNTKDKKNVTSDTALFFEIRRRTVADLILNNNKLRSNKRKRTREMRHLSFYFSSKE